MVAPPEVVSAGAVVLRKAPGADGTPAVEVLLVHRPRYDDWSFPKGKLDSGEHATVAAVREVAEETGLEVSLGPPLATQTYVISNGRDRLKAVHYWIGRVVGDDDISGYEANDEIDQVAWVPVGKARDLLSYDFDRDTLKEAGKRRKRSTPVLVLRHGKATPRSSWSADDRERPLNGLGETQADALVPMLAAYGVTRVVSSSSRRCWTTVAPYAESQGLVVEHTGDLTEEDADDHRVARVVRELAEGSESCVVCTHRPVLPLLFDELGVEPPTLEAGAFAVVHLRQGAIIATEVHTPPVR